MKRYDVVVIGAGVVGTAAAYELTRTGHKVALIDAKGLGGGASTASTSLLFFEESSKSLFDLCPKSFQILDTLDQELGMSFGYEPIKALSYIRREEDFAGAQMIRDRYVACDFEYEIVDAKQLHELEPALNMDGMLGALYHTIYRFDSQELLYAYFTKARELGMDWYYDCMVTGFEEKGGHITAVICENQTIQADQVLITTGAWTRDLMHALNIEIPQFYIQAGAMVMERGGITLNNVIYQFEPARAQIEESSSKLSMELGWENVPKQEAREFIITVDAHGNLLTAQASMVTSQITLTIPPEFVRDMAGNVKRFFPGFGSCKVLRSWICPVPFVPDRKPFFGFIAPYDNLMISTGYGSAFLMAPVMGKLTRATLDGEDHGYDLSEFEPRRYEREGFRWTI